MNANHKTHNKATRIPQRNKRKNTQTERKTTQLAARELGVHPGTMGVNETERRTTQLIKKERKTTQLNPSH